MEQETGYELARHLLAIAVRQMLAQCARRDEMFAAALSGKEGAKGGAYTTLGWEYNNRALLLHSMIGDMLAALPASERPEVPDFPLLPRF